MKAAFWTVMVLIGVLFLFSGAMKLLAREAVNGQFASWGYPAWFAIVIGILEILAAIALFLPKTGHAAASLIILLMLGAAFTHFRAEEFASLIVNGLVVVGSVFTLRHRGEFT